ncbi:SipW-dependent-type signal peptide-containing protein [Candidatus Soleaferrea massiliensis]|uniref:SipW-dependent-type signal peptide-containing protein n=1 Tax=Candidatus Soleaferrea massiliensis TaxID=1470354 RepID=UPI00058F9745|nr:SipW-dependent-type signal peptide-containing protein [Candidatus Soleaferrea massiliensis]
MAESQNTTSRRTIWMCGLSIILCLAMFIGTTLAWFSDTVSNKGNRIQAGDLKIGFYATDNEKLATDSKGEPNEEIESATWRNLKTETAPIFNFEGPAQPGDTLTRYIMIKNEGSIALKYFLDFVVNDGGLGDAVQVDLQRVQPTPDVDATTYTAKQMADLKVNGSSSTKGEYMIYKITMRFDASAGNTYQGGDVSMDINLTATQNKDDAIAGLTRVSTVDEINAAPANASIILMNNIFEKDEAITRTNLANIDLNGYTLYVKSFNVTNTDVIGTMDVTNSGKIGGLLVADTSDNAAKVDLPKCTVNWSAAAARLNEDGSITDIEINTIVSPHTFNYSAPASWTFTLPDGSTKTADIAPSINLLAGSLSVSEGSALTSVVIPASNTSETTKIENNGTIGTLNNQSGGTAVVEGTNPPGSTEGNIDSTIPVKANIVVNTGDTTVAWSGNYAFHIFRFHLDQNLNLKDSKANVVSSYEFSTDNGATWSSVLNNAGRVYSRSKYSDYICYGSDLVNPSKVGYNETMLSSTEYYFGVAGKNTKTNLDSIYSLSEGTDYQIRLVIKVTDKNGNETTNYSPAVKYTRGAKDGNDSFLGIVD